MKFGSILFFAVMLLKNTLLLAKVKNSSKKNKLEKVKKKVKSNKSLKKKNFISKPDIQLTKSISEKEDLKLNLDALKNKSKYSGEKKLLEFEIIDNSKEEDTHEKLFKFHQPNHKQSIKELKHKKKVSHDEDSDKIEEEDEMGYNVDYNPLDR